ncbi:MAG: efflux RND transporter periplasmic adaptor subunit [Planctomycetota bacterium]
MMRYLLQLLLAALILGGAGFVAKMLIDSRPPAPKHEVTPVVPIVRALAVHPEAVRVDVTTQGTVAPRTETTLVAEVRGKIARVAPSMVAGGFFAAGEELLTIDAREFELAVVAAQAEVAQRRTALAVERAEAEVAIAQWNELGRGEAPPLARREPQIAQADAALAAAEAGLQQAQLDLERCHVKAPYAGRVWDKRADVGQYVSPGTPLARVYAVDYAEVRLPLADDELQFLDLPLDYQDGVRAGEGPSVTLSTDFAGRTYAWPARVVRTEGEIDPKSRMVHAVARVEKPYARGDNGDAARPPLAVGMFVQATIAGREYEGVFTVPRSALRPGGEEVLVVDAQDRLQPRRIDVLRQTRTTVLVHGGLQAGERLCLTPLEVFSPGMRVQVAEPTAEETR